MIHMISKGEYSDYGVQCLLERKKRITESEASEAWAYWCGVRDVIWKKQNEYRAKKILEAFPQFELDPQGFLPNPFVALPKGEDKRYWALHQEISKVTEKMMPDPGEVMAEFLKAKLVPYVEHNVSY